MDELLAEMTSNPAGVRFTDACKVAKALFGEPRINGSHRIWSMKWQGDPRVNLQKGQGDLAKVYQVKQLLLAVETEKQRLEAEAKKAVAEPEKPKEPSKKAKKPKTGKKKKR